MALLYSSLQAREPVKLYNVPEEKKKNSWLSLRSRNNKKI